jgi:hypothetical protein
VGAGGVIDESHLAKLLYREQTLGITGQHTATLTSGEPPVESRLHTVTSRAFRRRDDGPDRRRARIWGAPPLTLRIGGRSSPANIIQLG